MKTVLPIKFKRLHPDARKPIRATEQAAAFDLFSIDDGVVQTEGVSIFDTGIAIEMPANYVALLFGRSGLAFKQAVQLANSCGVIDADYRNSIKIGLVKHDNDNYTHIKKGDRIGQLMFVQLPEVVFEEGELSETKRGLGGLGSTGLTKDEIIEKFLKED